MALTPLRYRRASYESATIARTDEQGNPVYHATLGEKRQPERMKILGKEFKWHEPNVSWIERATQRDFSIGISAGYLAISALSALTGGIPALATAGIVLGAGLIGGISDYTRNTKELNEGVEVKPPTRFNRDAVKAALGWGVLGKLAVTLVGMAIPAVGALSFLPALAWGAAAVGAGYGAMRGSEKGYQRMQREYQAVAFKHQNPDHGVAVSQQQERAKDIATSIAALGGTAIEAGAQATIGAQTAPGGGSWTDHVSGKAPARNNMVKLGQYTAAEQRREAQRGLAGSQEIS